MLTQQTVTHLRTLRLDGMARAFEEQLTQPLASGLAFEDRFGLLVDRELAWRDTRRLERLLKQAKLKYPEACIEDLDTRSARGLDARQLASLAGADWIRTGHNVLITGATGLGKTWLACALGQAACRQGFAVLYTRFGRLLEELRIAHGDGSFSRRLHQLARTDLLILDDWGLAPIGQSERNGLLELLDDRTTGKATLITSQVPVEHWYAYLNDPTLAATVPGWNDRGQYVGPCARWTPAVVSQDVVMEFSRVSGPWSTSCCQCSCVAMTKKAQCVKPAFEFG